MSDNTDNTVKLKDGETGYLSPNLKSDALSEVEAAAVANTKKTLQDNLDDLEKQRKS